MQRIVSARIRISLARARATDPLDLVESLDCPEVTGRGRCVATWLNGLQSSLHFVWANS